MLSYYVRRSSSEAFLKVKTPPEDNVWIHGDGVTGADLKLLAHRYSLNLNVLSDVLDANELPRVETRDGALYVFVRMVQRDTHGKVSTSPVLLVVKDNVFANLSAVTTTDHRLEAPKPTTEPIDTISLMLETFAAVISEYEDLTQRTAHYIHDTSVRLRTHEVTNDDFIKFVTIEGNINDYLMNLNSMQVVAERLKGLLKEGDDTEAVEDILLYIHQLIVSIKSYSQRITSIRNAYSTIANNVLNRRIKTLTVLTLLIALPNVFYGMYGMNVELPFQEQPWTYAAIISATIVIVLLVFIIVRKRGIF
jgi:magnesium transporter